ncbi:hypothetical protein N7519_000467 [Penicillium mononematosum]|uniref:uncharacterized protein n=1 Tax=Penicillium mononematosum TaxID=268346 RepID=UPI0025494E38|nr:uncharacterized protein N7519_000467 [Penicillium mononematosum]KAJ6190446.1 hypothetical protein N7519_000467 [Penicillium mononematosum]
MPWKYIRSKPIIFSGASPSTHVIHLRNGTEAIFLRATHGHQRPARAYDERPRRKLRCNVQLSQCGVCKEIGTVCEVAQPEA